MGTPKTSLEALNRLQRLREAWNRLCQTATSAPVDDAAHQVAATQALDLAAKNLGLLNKCRDKYGGFPDVDDVFKGIAEWATFGPANKARWWDYYALHMERPAVHRGEGNDCNSWGEQLDYWVGRCAGARARGRGEATHKAAALREVAEAFRAWGKLEKTDSPETRDAARTALELATRRLDIITSASNACGCHGSAAQPLALLQGFAAERGHKDFGEEWHWWDAFTQRSPCGSPREVGFPDELERWAGELERAASVEATCVPSGEAVDTASDPGRLNRSQQQASHADRCSTRPSGRESKQGEWVGPMTKAEIARRIVEDRKGRWRKAAKLFPDGYVEQVTGKTFRFRIDHLDDPTKDRCRHGVGQTRRRS